MNDDVAFGPLSVVFDATLIRAYGGPGNHIHADEEQAREFGFPGLVAWGTLTVQPFSALMESAFGPEWLIGGSLDVRLRRPVCAGDTVVYTARESRADANDSGHRVFELEGTSTRSGVVATARATVRLHAQSLTS